MGSCGHAVTAGLPSVSTVRFRSCRLGRSVGVQAIAGGLWPMVLAHNRSHASDQGQCVGSREIGIRCGRHNRAGISTILRRNVAPRARTSAPPARRPVARRRLWAIAAQSTHAEFAPKRPDGMCARGPSMRSAKTVSMIACRRWVTSASVAEVVVLVKNG